MDLRDLLSVVVRRWYFTTIVMLLSAATVFGLANLIGARYAVSATYALIPPESVIQNAVRMNTYAPANPLLYLGNLGQARDVFTRSMRSQQLSDQVGERFPGLAYEVAGDAQSSAPVMVITSEAQSADAALAGLAFLKSASSETLARLQNALLIKSSDQVTALELTSDNQAKVNRKTQLQLSLAAGLAVLIAGLLSLAVLDRTRLSRHSKTTPVLALSAEITELAASATPDDI